MDPYRLKRRTRKIIKAAVFPLRTAKEVRTHLIKRRVNKRRLVSYQEWFERQMPSVAGLEAQSREAKHLKYQPLVSIVLPVYDPPERFLRGCIESVINQTYENWQLCVVDDASPSAIIDVVKEYATKDKRIVWHRSDNNQHIAGASKKALTMANGEFVGLLDHDDLLLPYALFEVVSLLNRQPQADLIYSDEDKVDEKDRHMEPFFKPDWSPDFLHACNYITHFSVFRKTLLDKVGDFRMGTEGAQDWDLLLRFTQQTDNIFHIPKILYSWRKLPTSTAVNSESKPYAYINQLKVLRDSLSGRGREATSVFEHVYMGFWRVRYQIQQRPMVSIVIPTKNNYTYVEQCVRSIIEKSTYTNFEIVIVDTGSTDRDAREFYSSRLVTTNNVRVVNWTKPFNFSAVCNAGATAAKGDYLLFLNDDTKLITADWIEGMLEHAQRDDIGVVGCKLLFPTWRIQHAGVVLSKRDVAFHPFYNQHLLHDIFINIYVSNIRNCAAVTGACCMVSRKKFDAAGGFDDALEVTYGDVDLCLKMLDKGYHNLYTPFVELFHYESVSVGRITGNERDRAEIDKAFKIMQQRWAKYLARDPYYNDNFMQYGPGYDFEEVAT